MEKRQENVYWRQVLAASRNRKIALETRKSRQAVYRILYRAISWLEADYGPKVKFRLHGVRKKGAA